MSGFTVFQISYSLPDYKPEERLCLCMSGGSCSCFRLNVSVNRLKSVFARNIAKAVEVVPVEFGGFYRRFDASVSPKFPSSTLTPH